MIILLTMKRMIILLTTFIGILFVSCNSSIDSLISKYEKACVAGDYTKAAKYAADLEKKGDKITDEQAMKIAEAALNCSKATIDKYEDTYNSISDLEE